MFFRNYNKPGPGISKDAPKKKGVALYFEILMREFWSLVVVNLLFIVCSIPIITIGASYAALTHVTTKMVRDEPILSVISEFFKGFKQNWKQGTIAMAVMIFAYIIAFIAYSFYLANFEIFAYVILGVSVIMTGIFFYVFPILTVVHLPMGNVFKNSFILCIVGLKSTFIAYGLAVLFGIINLWFFPLTIILPLCITLSLACFSNTFAVYCTIEKYVIKGENLVEDSKEEN